MYKNEKWKDVVGFEGLYEVSDHGRIRSSKDKTTKSNLHGIRKWKQRIMSQTVGKDKTCRIKLYKDKKQYTFLVHRLVAKAFLENNDAERNHINHIDGNRFNNHLTNLEWCNSFENNNHAFDNGLMPTNKFIVLENLNNGELTRFVSSSDASKAIGRSGNFISEQLKKGIYIVDDYCIYTTKMDNSVRVAYIASDKND